MAQRSILLKPALEIMDMHQCPKCDRFTPSFEHCTICKAVLCGDCIGPHNQWHRAEFIKEGKNDQRNLQENDAQGNEEPPMEDEP
jgi:hypothetical protein